MLQVLAIVMGLGSLACWIYTLVKIFQANQIWQGVVGIICPLFAFIWGWIKSGELGIQKVMLIWTVLIILGFTFNLMVAGSVASQMRAAPPGVVLFGFAG